MKYTSILAVAALLFMSAPARAEVPAPGTTVSLANEPPNPIYWKQRLGLIESTQKWIESVKSYRNAFDLDRSPLTNRERQCLLSKIGQALNKAYYVTAAIGGDPTTIAGAEANYNYFTELVKFWCSGGDGQRGLKLFEHVVSDMGSETALPFSKIQEVAESKAPTYEEVSSGKSQGGIAAMVKSPTFWKAVRLIAFGPTHPLSGNPARLSMAELLKLTAKKASEGDAEAQRTLVIFSIVSAAAVSTGLPPAALGL